MLNSVLNTPLELSTIFANGSILMFEWVLEKDKKERKKLRKKERENCSKRDKNCEKPLKELFLETLQLRLGKNFLDISEKNSTEK